MQGSPVSPNKPKIFNKHIPKASLSPSHLPRSPHSRGISFQSSKHLPSCSTQRLIKTQQSSADKKLESGRSLMNYYLKQAFQVIKSDTTEQERRRLSKTMQNVTQIEDFQQYIRHYFECYNYFLKKIMPVHQKKVVQVPSDLKLRKRLLMSNQSIAEKKGKQFQNDMLSRQNQHLKRQLFRLKESTMELQKRILHLIAQYKQRKTIYLSEIQRLATIVNTSIQGIPRLFLDQRYHRQSRRPYFSADKQGPGRELMKKESEYNTLSSINEPINVAMEGIFKVFEENWNQDRSQLSRRGVN